MTMKSSRPRRAPVALALQLACASFACVLPAMPAMAQDVANRHYDIPAGPLGTTLNRFAQQAGVALVFQEQNVSGLGSQGLQGSYGIDEGFARLLKGSGFMAQRSGSGYVLRAVPQGDSSLELAPTSVTGRVLGATTEGTGTYTTGATATATKLPLSIRETPQSVSVITSQRIRDQDMNSLEDVLAEAPGVLYKKKSTSSDEEVGIFSRGMKIETFQVDGIPTIFEPSMSSQSNDMAVYDRVEIVRGATGLLSGTGNPSATINMVRKRPTREVQASIQGTVGSWDNYRTEFDVSGPLSETGNVRGRLVGAYQTANSFIDRLGTERQVAYGVIEADLSERDTISLGIDYQVRDCDACAYFGFPAFYSNGERTDFKRSFNSAADWSYADRQRTSIFATYEHRFDNDWLARVAYTNMRDDNDVEYGWFSSYGYPDPQTGAGSGLFMAKWPSRPEQNSVDAYLTGPFSLFGREHELVVGVSANKYRSNTGAYPLWYDYSGSGWDPAIPNVHDWRGDIEKPPLDRLGDIEYAQRQYAGYTSARFRPTDDLSLLLGARVSYYKVEQSQIYYGDPTDYAPGDGKKQENGEITPYTGLVYDLDRHHSVYASYTSIFKPQSSKTPEGAFLDPTEGDSYEVGTKGEYYDGRLNVSGALFESKVGNYPVGTSFYFDNGEEAVRAADLKVRGVELEVAGELLPGWQMQAGYSHVNTYYPQGVDVNVGFPRNSVKLFTTYNLRGELNRLTLGGGVRWESETSYGNTEVIPGTTLEATQGSYAIVDLLARYRFDEHFTGTLNVNNLFDKEYYASTSVYSDLYGEPRSLSATLRWEY
ncbi:MULTISPECIES: TonB-dependent siderophore receptor [unclassified Pseudomonas]|uniref:TonB-dependent siderophore receptor n=1 Tax=unclassified Pseudomonas TaxID=196821 RepID=UPI00244BAF90|nr:MULTISPECIES: TonB-dependent siderophore receptor [unclassified Pseudomonas]MDH0896736.1 TonB-dependent siderophore receptor [Pseudomonas sp. GD03875]MDH1065913.1 TonB-dependent siderophore receptor [Pseudomonas sp. GD03985]